MFGRGLRHDPSWFECMAVGGARAPKSAAVRRQRSLPAPPREGSHPYFAGVSVSVSFAAAATASGVNAQAYCSPAAQPSVWSV